ncbi:MAG TPA: right-handed parallel beta-helix repeat-containing protein [Phycisphaerae bacterium]|nr:right-handed parallel beta-helix repeat-containing protein [Phycisphaerae bacterium]HRY71275.1 right-handed parallel beta-helix repeat-containing protein [Phycisphaerae bacterium]HSA29633.1 right-handed parallel beta-helix repeat-containing protein [Phycisphaerae bacterium]
MKRALLHPATCGVIVCLASAPAARATTFFVNATCGDDSWSGRSSACTAPAGPKRTVQAAVNAASTGDEVVLAPGIYSGAGNTELNLGPSSITVRSETPDDSHIVAATVLDGQWRKALFRSIYPQTSEINIRGLTFRRGYSYPNAHAGGITVLYGHATIELCVFEANIGSFGGGAVACMNSEATIRNCVFIGNTVAGEGGAVHCTSGTPTIVNCSFVANGARTGGAISVSSSEGIPVIRNCILWGNRATTRDTHQIAVTNATPTVDYCDIEGGTGQWWFHSNNIDVDPKLTADGHLRQGSPCIDAGTGIGAPSSDRDGEERPSGVGVDIGADEYMDSDADQLPDFWERRCFDSATAAAPHDDSDSDDLDNAGEYSAGSNPRNEDSDEDAWRDGDETARGTDPIRPNIYVDGASGDDLLDGRAPIWSGGTHGPKRTIQAGITAAGPFESVVIRPGVYSGTGNYNLDFAAGLATGARPVTVQSEDPHDPAVVLSTIIDPKQLGRAFRIRYAYSRLTCVQGLTLCNGRAHAAIAPTSGGAIKCDESNPTIRNCVLTDHIADHGGTNWDGKGGAINLTASYPLLADCRFRVNTAPQGGAVFCDNSEPSIIHCQFADNSAVKGGAIGMGANVAPPIDRCVFAANVSSGAGGAIHCESAAPTITNCLFTANSAPGGGGFYAYGGAPVLLNCTLTGNSSLEGWGGGVSLESSPAVVENCIVWGNSPSQVHNRYGVEPTVVYSDIEGGWAGDGNIDLDPRFAAPGGTDGDPDTWQDNDYRLSEDSPCIDAGNNNSWVSLSAVDLLGLPRRIDAPATPDSGVGVPPIIDLGAYEFMPAIPGDLDGDRDVDTDDFSLFLACVSGPTIPLAPGCENRDFNHDGFVDQQDFGLFQRCYSGAGEPANQNCAN